MNTQTPGELIVESERLLTTALNSMRGPTRFTEIEMQQITMGATVASGLAALAQAKIATEAAKPIVVTQRWGGLDLQRCGHGVMALLNGDHWVHPAGMTECDGPPITDGPL
jgi:hypothetical protein